MEYRKAKEILESYLRVADLPWIENNIDIPEFREAVETAIKSLGYSIRITENDDDLFKV